MEEAPWQDQYNDVNSKTTLLLDSYDNYNDNDKTEN